MDKTRPSKIALVVLLLIILSGVIGPLIVHENGAIPYDASVIDFNAMNFQAPSFENLHLFGTDKVGRDVFAGCIYGIRHAFGFSLLASFVAIVIGLCIGIISGFYHGRGIRLSTSVFLGIIIGSISFLIMILTSFPNGIAIASPFDFGMAILFSAVFSIVLSLLCVQIFKLLKFNRKMQINIDLLLNRIVEVLDSLPTLFILITALAFFTSNHFNTAIIVGSLMWVNLSRIIRAEIIKIKEEQFIESTKALGIGNLRIVFHHILPNIIKPLLTQSIFVFSNAILIDSTLNFLGIGINITEISWGSLLSEAGQNLQAWWILVFPGGLLFLTIYCLRVLSFNLENITQDTRL